MSVLRCSICESNRQVLTELVQEITSKLTQSFSGYSEKFKNLICSNCQSNCKKFTFAGYQIESDSQGNYTANNLSEFRPEINSLIIIQHYQSTIDSLQPTCICGHSFN